MRKLLILLTVLMSALALANQAHAEEIKSKDRTIRLYLSTNLPSIQTDYTCRKKCKAYRIKTSELTTKDKVVKNFYTTEKTDPELIYLADLKPYTKYTLQIEKRSGKTWTAVKNSKITFRTNPAQITTAPTQLSSPIVLGTSTQIKNPTPTTPTPTNTFIPIQASAYTLDNPVLYKGHQSQQIYKAKVTIPSNRDVTIKGLVISTPRELKIINARLFLNSYEFAKGVNATDQGELVFRGDVSAPASSSFYLTVYADLPMDIPIGTGNTSFGGIATAASGQYFESISDGGLGITCQIETRDKNPQSTTKRIDLGEGLVVELYKEGTGTTVAANKQVAVHYIGTLENGTKFDSSVDRGQPFVFTASVGQVILGWDRSIVGRKVGDQFRVYIPAALAYGNNSAGSIPPNSNLIFDIAVLQTE